MELERRILEAERETSQKSGSLSRDRLGLLFETHRGLLLSRCRQLLRGSPDAEDIVQRTFLRAWQRAPEFVDQNPAGWLCRIAQRLCIDLVRSRRPLEVSAAPEEIAADHGAPAAPDAIALAASMKEILALLEPKHRICLKLFYIEGCSFEEIARSTGYSVTQVRGYVERGRRRLRQLWLESR